MNNGVNWYSRNPVLLRESNEATLHRWIDLYTRDLENSFNPTYAMWILSEIAVELERREREGKRNGK